MTTYILTALTLLFTKLIEMLVYYIILNCIINPLPLFWQKLRWERVNIQFVLHKYKSSKEVLLKCFEAHVYEFCWCLSASRSLIKLSTQLSVSREEQNILNKAPWITLAAGFNERAQLSNAESQTLHTFNPSYNSSLIKALLQPQRRI